MTLAPEMAAPEESVTLPPTAPSVVDCALALMPSDNTLMTQKQNAVNQVEMRLAFINTLLRINSKSKSSTAHKPKPCSPIPRGVGGLSITPNDDHHDDEHQTCMLQAPIPM